MKRGLAAVVVALAGVGGQVSPACPSQAMTPVAELRELVKSAEAIIAADIVQVDDRATAVDGPLILEAKVLAALKGGVRIGQTVRTWEAAQVAGNYSVGQWRLLLLRRQRPIEPYHRDAAWWNMPIAIEVSIEKTAVDQLTVEALEEWLDSQITTRPPMPAVEIQSRGPAMIASSWT